MSRPMPEEIDRQAPERVELLTAIEVAAILRVSPAWVYAETRRRRIPHIRLGRYVRYRTDAITRWMEDLETSSGAAPPVLPRPLGIDGRLRRPTRGPGRPAGRP